jgi:cytochrome c oxidase subunit 3
MEEWLGLGRPAVRRAAPWLIGTVILGALFLAGQWIAWGQLASQGLTFTTTQNSHFFYLITAAHGVHLVLGILALAVALCALFLIRRVQMRQIVVDVTAWYWHAMGIFWIFLFVLLTCFQ